jgi:Holliday junction resolvase RusA-like endonuclease
MLQTFLIKGHAIPAQRPRSGYGGVFYIPQETKNWKNNVYIQVSAAKPILFPEKIPLKIIAFCFFKKPQKSKYNTPISHDLGDWDNLGKSICDALQGQNIKFGTSILREKGLVFSDDCVITDGIVRKYYTDDKSFVLLRVTDEMENYRAERLWTNTKYIQRSLTSIMTTELVLSTT